MRINYVSRYNSMPETIECEDLIIIAQSDACCSIKFLGEETGKNEEGVIVRKVIKVVFGITDYQFG